MISLRHVAAVARKETRYLQREWRALVVCFLEPVVFVVLFGYCINFNQERIPFAVWDQDRTATSARFTRALASGTARRPFSLLGSLRRHGEIEPLLAAGRARFVLVLPPRFEQDLLAGRSPAVQMLVDAADPNAAAIATGYLRAAVARYNLQLHQDAPAPAGAAAARPALVPAAADEAEGVPLRIRTRILYNPALESPRFVVPGLMAILLTLLATTLTCTTLTREGERGTLETLLFAPLSGAEIVLGKLLPYVAVAAGNVGLVLLVGGLVFGVWPAGSLLTLALFTLLFLPAMLAVGVLLSAIAPSQQLSVMLALYTTLLPTYFLTGFALPRSNMPALLQAVSWPLPATHYLIAVRAIYLKGTGWGDLWPHALWLAGATVATIFLASWMVARRLSAGLE